MELTLKAPLSSYCHPTEESQGTPLGFQRDGQNQKTIKNKIPQIKQQTPKLPKIIQRCSRKSSLHQKLKGMGSFWEGLSLGVRTAGGFLSTEWLMSLACCWCEN